MKITNENVGMYLLKSSRCKSFDEFGAIELEEYHYVLLEWAEDGVSMDLEYEQVEAWINGNVDLDGNTIDDYILHISTADKMGLINGVLKQALCK